MKIREPADSAETEDKYGQDVALYVDSKALRELFEQLYNSFGGQGYKFVIVFDVSREEYTAPGKEMPIYFMDCILPEFADYANIEWREKPWTEPQPQSSGNKPLTNIDLIRAMSTDELAKWLVSNTTDCGKCFAFSNECDGDYCGDGVCIERVIRWLNSRAE